MLCAARYNAASTCRSGSDSRRKLAPFETAGTDFEDGCTPPRLANKRWPVASDTPASDAASTTDKPSDTPAQNRRGTSIGTAGRTMLTRMIEVMR